MKISQFANKLVAIAIMFIWLMPVSNQLNTLNESMLRNGYIATLLVLMLVYVYERRFNIKMILIGVSILSILIIFSFIFYATYQGSSVISWGYLFNFLSFCILINIKPSKLSKISIWDTLLDWISVLLISVGILTVMDNKIVEEILRTYYVNHYPHVYTMMYLKRKTVTFFATHSISCMIYFLIWWMLDYRNSRKFQWKNSIFMAGMLFDIVMCQSVSAVMCALIIIGYYYIQWIRHANKKHIIISVELMAVIIAILILNIDKINLILGSNVNGINGRFGENGNLWGTLHFAFKNMIPMGFCDIDGFWLTDGGYFINFIRGGIPLIVLYYYGLFWFLKRNIQDKYRRTYLFISLLLFEVGYQFSNCLRFFMLALIMVCFCSWIDKQYSKV